MDLTSGYAVLPVMAATLGGPVLVAAGGLVVVLAILLVFVMVLRSNGDARKASRGIGYDSHQGAYGQSRAPVSQPNRGQRPAPPWSDEYNGQRGPASRPNAGPATGDNWGGYGSASAPAGANMGRGGPGRGSPSGVGWGDQPVSSPQWGAPMDNPNQPSQWGGQPAAQGPAQGGWDAPAARGDWNNPQPEPQQAWNAPPTTPRGWDQPAMPGNVPGAQNWPSAPANPPAPARPEWDAPAPAAAPPSFGRPDYNGGGYGGNAYAEDQRTFVVRPASAQGEPKLVVSEGKEPGRNYEIRKDRITIGRSRESDVFLEDLAVSRTHTTINRQPDGSYLLRDERSANGTLVNGQRVNDHVLEDGDKIQVGQTLLVFVYR
ncbi:MAG: FHA domain-containing protein [Nitrososphaerota archaeon]